MKLTPRFTNIQEVIVLLSRTALKKEKNLGKAKARLMNQSTRRLTSHFKVSISPENLAKKSFVLEVVVDAKKERERERAEKSLRDN